MICFLHTIKSQRTDIEEKEKNMPSQEILQLLKFYICNRNVFRKRMIQYNRKMFISYYYIKTLVMQKRLYAGPNMNFHFLLTGCFAIFKMFNLLVVCSTMRNVSVRECVSELEKR